MKWVFGELYLQQPLYDTDDIMAIADNSGRDLEVEKGETIYLGYKDGFETRKLEFNYIKKTADDGKIKIVSTDEHEFPFENLCLVIKES